MPIWVEAVRPAAGLVLNKRYWLLACTTLADGSKQYRVIDPSTEQTTDAPAECFRDALGYQNRKGQPC